MLKLKPTIGRRVNLMCLIYKKEIIFNNFIANYSNLLGCNMYDEIFDSSVIININHDDNRYILGF